MTMDGGSGYSGPGTGDGTIFSIPTTGGLPTVLFYCYEPQVDCPAGELTVSGTILYGLSPWGGAFGGGAIFSIPTNGGTPNILFSFDGTHGASPYGKLTLSGSTFYGMTCYGGNGFDGGGYSGSGTIFCIPVTGGSPTILYYFDGARGSYPFGSLTLSGSTLYGMTAGAAGGENTLPRGGYGTIFSIPTSGGTPTVLFHFEGTHGANPTGSLILSGSTLYGMTAEGGANNDGTIFSIPTSGGTPNILFSFDGTRGAGPAGNLTLNGSTLYGMTTFGGSGYTGASNTGSGVIFSIPTTGGTPTILSHFDGAHGANPLGSLTLGSSTLYGTTWGGGAYGAYGNGVVFSIPILLYTLSVNQTPGGTVTVSPSQATYSPSTVLTISASANPGYRFVSWSVTGGSVANAGSATTSLTITDNCTLSASYMAKTLSVTAATATTWVYQNTPSVTRDRHVLALTVSVTADTWGNSSYTVSVDQVGPGVVTPTNAWTFNSNVTPTGRAEVVWSGAANALSGYLVGGRVQGTVLGLTNSVNVTVIGSCTVTVKVAGNLGGTASVTLPAITVRALGDIAGTGSFTSATNLMNGKIHASTSTSITGLDPEVWDLNGYLYVPYNGQTSTITAEANLLHGLVHGGAVN
jgi:uncharacterized repeat protein (TIGR03803 family)